jgi:hypothetical protein
MRYAPLVSFLNACFSISTDGAFWSLPDSSW